MPSTISYTDVAETRVRKCTVETRPGTFFVPTQTAITAQCERSHKKYYFISVVQPSQHFGVITGERAEKHYRTQSEMALYPFKLILDKTRLGSREGYFANFAPTVRSVDIWWSCGSWKMSLIFSGQ